MDQHFVFEGKHLHYRTTGQGPAVLLLHGFLESLQIWDALTIHMQDRFQLIVLDLPGHGRSENLSDVHAMEDMAEVAYMLLKHVGVSSCVVIGHSMGGYVGLAMARLYPDNVRSVILLHSHAGADSDEARLNRDRTIAAVKANHTGFIHAFIPGVFAPGNRDRLATEIQALSNRAAGTSRKAIIAALEGMKQRHDQVAYLATHPLPVLFIAGKEDERIPFDLIVDQVNQCHHAELLTLENTGHMGHMECPESVFPVILSFCQLHLN